MKKIKYLLLLVPFAALPWGLQGQTLKVMEWNILSFEGNGEGQPNDFNVQPFVDFILEKDPDIVCFNELETVTSRVYNTEKLTEICNQTGMFPFFGYSYDKSDGYYGNGILSKYPIVNAYSQQLGMWGGADQRSVEYVDILVPTDAKPEGVKIRIACTHLDHQNSGDNKTSQANEAFDIAMPDAGEDIPMLFIGDLNISSPTGSNLTYINSLCDRICDNTNTFGNSSKLDYIFSYPQGAWTRVSYEVFRNTTLSSLSDHYPIMGVATVN